MFSSLLKNGIELLLYVATPLIDFSIAIGHVRILRTKCLNDSLGHFGGLRGSRQFDSLLRVFRGVYRLSSCFFGCDFRVSHITK